MTATSIGDIRVIFILSQVSDTKGATNFLWSLKRDKEIGNIMFCSIHKPDQVMVKFEKERHNTGYTS